MSMGGAAVGTAVVVVCLLWSLALERVERERESQIVEVSYFLEG